MESLDILANNLANTSTAGFKLDRESFNIYISPDATGNETNPVSQSPITERHTTSLAQGSLTETGNSLDIALEGQGFLTASAGDKVVYTRSGQIKIGKDGALETPPANAVQKEPDTTPITW